MTDINNKYDPIPVRDVHERMMKEDLEYSAAYNALEPRFILIAAMIEARDKKGLTQKKIAERMETSTTALSRMFNSKQNVTWDTITKFAKATNTRPVVYFEDV